MRSANTPTPNPSVDGKEEYIVQAIGNNGLKTLNFAVQRRHCDVGSTYPGGGEAPKGLAVRQ